LASTEDIRQAVLRAVDDVNGLLPADRRLGTAPDTALTGEQAVLDSLGLVNFLVAVEAAVAERTGVGISLINEDSMSRQPSPFSTIASLVEYAHSLTQ
jgi:hypothetical protein